MHIRLGFGDALCGVWFCLKMASRPGSGLWAAQRWTGPGVRCPMRLICPVWSGAADTFLASQSVGGHLLHLSPCRHQTAGTNPSLLINSYRPGHCLVHWLVDDPKPGCLIVFLSSVFHVLFSCCLLCFLRYFSFVFSCFVFLYLLSSSLSSSSSSSYWFCDFVVVLNVLYFTTWAVFVYFLFACFFSSALCVSSPFLR